MEYQWIEYYSIGVCLCALDNPPEKSLEGTLCNVPSFGGHIAISDDVITYPFLAMARTIYRNFHRTIKNVTEYDIADAWRCHKL